MNTLEQEIINNVNSLGFQENAIGKKFVQRAKQGALTRDESAIHIFVSIFYHTALSQKKFF